MTATPAALGDAQTPATGRPRLPRGHAARQVSLQVRDLTRATDSAPTLSANGIARRYGAALALRGVDVTLHAGEAVAVFGPNGAGKTTLIRVLATLLRPNAGSLRV